MNNVSVGRIVHFVVQGVHYAAIVTKCWSGSVNLFVFDNGDGQLGSSIFTSVEEDNTASTNFSWHWPEKV